MIAAVRRETLEKFYHRVYGDQRWLRLVSMTGIAALTAYAQVWAWPWAVVWLAAYAASELSLVVWWRRIHPRLARADQGAVGQLETQLIAICAVSCALCAAPCFVTPFSS